jgi:hypothetical protein
VYGHYEQVVDRESAYEKLKARTIEKEPAREQGGRGAMEQPGQEASSTLTSILFGSTGPRGGHHDGLLDAAAKSAVRALGSGVGRAILRGTLGSILGGARGRR